ncbi:MAG: DinB family protein [Chloroflexia bacterium]|nr:DinB family protein [Chloroflexia bacterium]
MSERAQAPADKFEDAHNEIVTTVEEMSEDRWKAMCAGEERTVGVVAHHVASSYASTFGIAQLAASGQPLPTVSWDMIHDMNAKHASENSTCTKAETLALMRGEGERVRSGIAELSDGQLDQKFVLPAFGPDEITVEFLINMLVIGHVGMHVPSIQAPAACVRSAPVPRPAAPSQWGSQRST